MRRPFVLIAAAAVTVLLGVGGAAAAYLAFLQPEEKARTPQTRLDLPDPPEAAGPKPKAKPKPKPKPDTFKWRHYGYSTDHRRWFKSPKSFRGPFAKVWQRKAPALLEFPPVMSNGALFQLADNGQLKSLRKTDGRTLWKKKLGRLAASSPALGDNPIFVTLLDSGPGGRGRIVALRQRKGKRRWSRVLPSRSESSPLVHKGRIYFSTEFSRRWVRSARTGRVRWRYRAGGAIKGSPTLAHGKLFFGDYGGRVQAVRVKSGRRVWSSSGAGRFYATAAVAGKRVYIGSTAGRVYAFSTRNGRLKWSHQTGRYVYASAAIARVRGWGRTLFVGSYDGRFYALDAGNGRVRWTYNSGGKISGSATVIGRVVYFADLGRRRTIGLQTRTGRVSFRRGYGAYDPVISDGKHLYVTGNHTLTKLRPWRPGRAAKRKAARKRR